MTAAKPKTEEKRVTITSLVRDAWEGHDGDMPGAIEELFATVSGNQALLAEILPGVLRSWCRDQVGDYVGRLRIAAIAPVEDPARGNRLRSAIATSLFDFPLPGGKRLGDANAKEILTGSEAYNASAQDAAHKSRWLAAVADRVGRKNRAENALTLQQLEELYEETRDGK